MDELVDALKNLGAQVSQSIFNNPSKDEIVGLYCLAIQEVLGKAITQVRYEEAMGTLKSNPKFNVFETYTFTIERDSYKSLGDLRFYRYCQRLHALLGLEPMNPSTILTPVSADIKKFGKAFLSFLRFRDEVLHLLDFNMETLIQSIDSKYSLTADIEAITTELEQFSMANRTDLNSINAMKQTKITLETKLSRIKEEYGFLQKRYSAIESKIAELNRYIEDITVQIDIAQQSKQELQEQIVKDPSIYRNELAGYKREVESERKEVEALQNIEARLRERRDNLLKSSNLLQTANDKIKSHLDTVVTPCSKLVNEIANCTNQSKELDNKLKDLEEQITVRNNILAACKNEQDTILKQTMSLDKVNENNKKRLGEMDQMANEKIEAVYKIVQERESSIMEMRNEIKKYDILKVKQNTNFNGCIQEILNLILPYEKLRLN